MRQDHQEGPTLLLSSLSDSCCSCCCSCVLVVVIVAILEVAVVVEILVALAVFVVVGSTVVLAAMMGAATGPKRTTYLTEAFMKAYKAMDKELGLIRIWIWENGCNHSEVGNNSMSSAFNCCIYFIASFH
ncbi:hypothetical protein Ahy_B01g052644 isoform A [Arachis hypogaea]|uniref:Uncharacterized protein n=1 Tax=Arachis hypogaea TaxID=3818 RepID=A0A445AQ37_ARAHY|nr:hypothetical protein Ahy_B01g052644 isoform A [Arachis hypogaea]